MVDSVLEVNRKSEPIHCFVNIAKKLPRIKTLDINAYGGKSAKIACNAARLVSHFYDKVTTEINLPYDHRRFGRKDEDRFLIRVNVYGGDDYKSKPVNNVLKDRYIIGFNHAGMLKLRQNDTVTYNEALKIFHKKYYKLNTDILGPAKQQNLSNITVSFSPDIKKYKFYSNRYTIFGGIKNISNKKYSKLNPRVYNLSTNSFALLSKKVGCYFDVSIRRKGLRRVLGKNLEDFNCRSCEEEQLIEDGKMDILRIINCNLEGRDVKEVTDMKELKGAYKNIFLKHVLGSITHEFRKVIERGNGHCLENIVSNYNKVSEDEGWKPTNKGEIVNMINNITPKPINF